MEKETKYYVLIVDDEQDTLDLLGAVLRRRYNVLKADSGEQAKKILQENDIALVLSDQWMGGMSGIELLTWMREKAPDAGRILITGFAEMQIVKDAINKGHVHRFVSKPWEVDEIRNIVADEIERYRFKAERLQLLNDLIRKNDELMQANDEIMYAKRRLEELNRELKEQSEIAIELSEKFAKAHVDLLKAHEEIARKNKQLEIANRELERLSITDELTSFYNKRYLGELLDNEIGRAKRYDLKLTCMMVDLDYFKTVNDTFGHLFGDLVLRTIAQLIQKNIRDTDFPIRYGGDEFFILLPHTDIEQAAYLAERISRDARNYLFTPTKDRTYQQKISVGLTALELTTDQTKEDMIARVDQALYQAKDAGRDRICVQD